MRVKGKEVNSFSLCHCPKICRNRIKDILGESSKALWRPQTIVGTDSRRATRTIATKVLLIDKQKNYQAFGLYYCAVLNIANTRIPRTARKWLAS
jgi:hypothetical protein